MDLAIVPPLRRSLHTEKAPHPLRDQLAELIEDSAIDLLDPERLAVHAEDMRLKERDRVHHIGLVVNALVLSALQRSTPTGACSMRAGPTRRSAARRRARTRSGATCTRPFP